VKQVDSRQSDDPVRSLVGDGSVRLLGEPPVTLQRVLAPDARISDPTESTRPIEPIEQVLVQRRRGPGATPAAVSPPWSAPVGGLPSPSVLSRTEPFSGARPDLSDGAELSIRDLAGRMHQTAVAPLPEVAGATTELMGSMGPEAPDAQVLPTPAWTTEPGRPTSAQRPAELGEGELDDLARRLYSRIRRQLRSELRVDRERSGTYIGVPR
jgi:hypothetical protein